MGSAQSWIEDSPKFTRTLVRWHSRALPEAVTIHLVTSKHNFWSLAIDFESAANLDLKTFSGLMVIPQLLGNRRIYVQVVNWPCEETVAAFPVETCTTLRLGTISSMKVCQHLKLSSYVSTYELTFEFLTCDLMVSAFNLAILHAFEKLCKQTHPGSQAPSTTLAFRKQDGGLHEVEWPETEFPHGDYWDDQLNDKSAILAILEFLGLPTHIARPANMEIDAVMATLITKAEIPPALPAWRPEYLKPARLPANSQEQNEMDEKL